MDGEPQQAEAVLPAQDAGPRTPVPGPPDPDPRPSTGPIAELTTGPSEDLSEGPSDGPSEGLSADPATATAIASAPADRHRPDPYPYLLAAAFFLLYTALSVSRYRRMLTMSWDLGIFEQAVRGYAHLRAPITDLKGPGFNVLGDHFSPITALIAPFYRVFPTPVTLLIAQALLLALSAVPVTRAATRALGRAKGLAIGAAYGLSWGIQNAVDFDFHEIAFAMPLLAFSLEAVLRKRWTAAMWWAVPLVLVKEDLGASVAAIGLVVWWRTGRGGRSGQPGRAQAHRSRSRTPAEARADFQTRTYALGLMCFGAAASIWEVNRFIPAFNGPGYDPFNHLDGDGTLTGHIPLDTAIRTLLWLLLPAGGLLALRSPLALVALPTLGWRFLSHYPGNWGTGWHYSAVLMPVLFLALVDAAGRSSRSRMPWLRAYASGLPVAMAAAALALSTQLPLATLTHPDTYTVDARTRAAERLLDRIPDRATVEANIGPISRLVRRTTVYWVGGTEGVVPRYIALENASDPVPDPIAYAEQLHPGTRYALVGNAGGYVVLRRV